MPDLTAFQRDIIAVVAHRLEKPHGLGILSERSDWYDDDVLSGRLYANLNTLVEDSLLEKGEKDERTNEYTVSTAGREWLTDYICWIRGAPID